jgi:YegS/Rv2252/BmrU family lipid kinase
LSVTVIINPVSGGLRSDRARERAALAASLLRSCGEDGDVVVTERKGHARELAAAAVARGVRLVVAWGGDGTVNEIASALIARSAAIGIVPSGSGNGLAGELGIARRPEVALPEALRGSPRAIDAGELGGRVFVNLAGVGFDAHVARCFDREGGSRGLSGYIRISIRELFAYRSATYRIGCDGRALSGALPTGGGRTALIVTLANGSQFGNGMRIAPDARVDDGKLDLVVFEETSRVRTFGLLPRFFADRIRETRGLSVERIERATIECDHPMTFHVDGEPVEGGTRLAAKVLPAVLRVSVR